MRIGPAFYKGKLTFRSRFPDQTWKSDHSSIGPIQTQELEQTFVSELSLVPKLRSGVGPGAFFCQSFGLGCLYDLFR